MRQRTSDGVAVTVARSAPATAVADTRCQAPGSTHNHVGNCGTVQPDPPGDKPIGPGPGTRSVRAARDTSTFGLTTTALAAGATPGAAVFDDHASTKLGAARFDLKTKRLATDPAGNTSPGAQKYPTQDPRPPPAPSSRLANEPTGPNDEQ